MSDTMKTPRVRLRPLRLDDLPVYRSWSAPGAAWQALDGPYYPVSADDLERQIVKMTSWIEAGHEPDPLRRLAIADPGTDALLGTVSRYWISQETLWPAAGITLYDPGTWGRGIGADALRLWVDMLFREQPEIVRLDLRTWSGNTRMMGLATKLGFQLEACFRRARIVDGVYYDGLGYGILREEWAPGVL